MSVLRGNLQRKLLIRTCESVRHREVSVLWDVPFKRFCCIIYFRKYGGMILRYSIFDNFFGRRYGNFVPYSDVTEIKIHKKVAGTTIFCNKSNGTTVISNLTSPLDMSLRVRLDLGEAG